MPFWVLGHEQAGQAEYRRDMKLNLPKSQKQEHYNLITFGCLLHILTHSINGTLHTNRMGMKAAIVVVTLWPISPAAGSRYVPSKGYDSLRRGDDPRLFFPTG